MVNNVFKSIFYNTYKMFSLAQHFKEKYLQYVLQLKSTYWTEVLLITDSIKANLLSNFSLKYHNMTADLRV